MNRGIRILALALVWVTLWGNLHAFDNVHNQPLTFDESRHLQRSSPMDRLKIYEGILKRYQQEIREGARSYRNPMLKGSCDRFIMVLDLVDGDLRLCMAERRNARKGVVRRFEISLRKALVDISGIQKALPYNVRIDMEPLVRRLAELREKLFEFVNGSPEDSD